MSDVDTVLLVWGTVGAILLGKLLGRLLGEAYKSVKKRRKRQKGPTMTVERYVQNPAIFEVMQVKSNVQNLPQLVEWLTNAGATYMMAGNTGVVINTPTGNQTANVGDYILKDNKGRFSVETEEAFQDNYRKAGNDGR